MLVPAISRCSAGGAEQYTILRKHWSPETYQVHIAGTIY